MIAKTNGGDTGASEREAGRRRSAWRSPTVIWALGAAAIAGAFGGVQGLVPLFRNSMQASQATQATATREESPFDFSFHPYAKSMADVQRALRKEKGAIPIPKKRLEAIAALRGLAADAAPADHVLQSIEILVAYLTFATEERRGVSDRHSVIDEHDGIRVTRLESVVAALGALQAVRKSAAEPPQVRIGGIDFSYINLEGVDLSGLDASHGRFRHAFLSGCNCERTIFDHADLREAVIWTRERSNFRAARFTGAQILGSKWANVDLSGSNIEAAAGRPTDWMDIVPSEKQALFR